MVKDAEAAGFNPLTAIRNGGSAGYTVTSHPALSSGAFLADAIGGVGRAIASIDPMAQKTADLEFEIRQATLENLQADTAARKRASIGGVPVSTGGMHARAVPDLYSPYRDNSAAGGGKIVWLPNPDLSDNEQIVMPALATNEPGGGGYRLLDNASRGAGAAAEAAFGPEPWVKSRPLTEEEKRAREDSWWPAWLPSVSFK